MEKGGPKFGYPGEVEDPWRRHLLKTEGDPPSELLKSALKQLSFQAREAALDLGAGGMKDAVFLARAVGFREVVAIDNSPAAAEIFAKKFTREELMEGRVKFFCQEFGQYSFPTNKFDLVSAQFSLPFAEEESAGLVEKIFKSLKPGGIFAGQLLGERDDWRKSKRVTIFGKDSIQKLFERFNILHFKELEGEIGKSSKENWHLFEIIARKNQV
jgi:SAM-dependent methyltransferase